MELRQLKYVIKITECGTLLKASEELFISQSGLTRSIQSLENELGVELFDRVKKRLVLNEYGELFVEEAKKILKDIDLLQTKIINQYKQNSNIIIGSCAPTPLCAISKSIKSDYPQVIFKSEIKNSTQSLITDFNNHYYSAIILDEPLETESTLCFKLCDEILNVAVTLDHPFASKKEITFQELNGNNFIEYNNNGYWHDVCVNNMPESHIIVQNDYELYKIIEQQSNLFTFGTSLTIPKSNFNENRIYIPIKDQAATLSFYLICDKKHAPKINKIKDLINHTHWDYPFHESQH